MQRVSAPDTGNVNSALHQTLAVILGVIAPLLSSAAPTLEVSVVDRRTYLSTNAIEVIIKGDFVKFTVAD